MCQRETASYTHPASIFQPSREADSVSPLQPRSLEPWKYCIYLLPFILFHVQSLSEVKAVRDVSMDFTRRRFPLTVKSLCSNIHDEFLPSGPSECGGDPRSPAESSVTAEEQGQRDVTVHQGNGGVFMATYRMWKFPGRNPGYPITYEVQPRHMVADAMQINKDYFKPSVFEYSDNDNKTDTPVESAPQGAAEQAQPEARVCAGKHISYKPAVVSIAIAEEDESEVFSSTTRTFLSPPDRFSRIPLYPTPILHSPNSPSLQRRSVRFTVDTDFANIPSSTSALMQSEICDATQVQETSSICSDMAQSRRLPPTSSRRKSLFGVDLGRADMPTGFPGPARRRHSSTTYRGIRHGTSYATQLSHECQKRAAISRRKSRKQRHSEYHKGQPSLLERTGISLSDVRMRFSSLSKRSEQQNNDYSSDKDVLQPFPMGAEHRHRSRRLPSGLLSVDVGVGITSEDLTPAAVDDSDSLEELAPELPRGRLETVPSMSSSHSNRNSITSIARTSPARRPDRLSSPEIHTLPSSLRHPPLLGSSSPASGAWIAQVSPDNLLPVEINTSPNSPRLVPPSLGSPSSVGSWVTQASTGSSHSGGTNRAEGKAMCISGGQLPPESRRQQARRTEFARSSSPIRSPLRLLPPIEKSVSTRTSDRRSLAMASAPSPGTCYSGRLGGLVQHETRKSVDLQEQRLVVTSSPRIRIPVPTIVIHPPEQDDSIQPSLND